MGGNTVLESEFMNPTVQPSPADDARLGAQVGADGTRFSLWAPRATRVELALVDEHRRQTNHDLKLVGERSCHDGATPER